jgi:hypothetical protein
MEISKTDPFSITEKYPLDDCSPVPGVRVGPVEGTFPGGVVISARPQLFSPIFSAEPVQ